MTRAEALELIRSRTASGELAAAHPHNGLGNQRWRELRATQPVQFEPKLRIVDDRLHLPREPERHLQNDETSRVHGFEAAVAIGKAAFIPIELSDGACCQLHGPQAVYPIRQLHPVGTNILQGRCPNGAGYQSQVLESGQPLTNGKTNEPMPALPGRRRDRHRFPAARLDADTTGANDRNGSWDVASENDVAAASKHQQITPLRGGFTHERLQRLLTLDHDDPIRRCRDAQGIESIQAWHGAHAETTVRKERLTRSPTGRRVLVSVWARCRS